MGQLIECVPNFSEGRRKEVIDAIVSAISGSQVAGERVRILNVDPGAAANRTVVTFAGTPEAVCEAAFQGVRRAAELIDMSKQHGTHPRTGATDVLPLVPLSGISLEECAVLARDLGRRLYEELGIPCYCYEAAAFRPERKNLAVCRAGEYESLPRKMADSSLRPDFGPSEYDARTARTGATSVGARPLLLAVNFNLNTQDVETAKSIASAVRQKGRPDRKWKLEGCKAIGWYIEEYGIAQVSMNMTDLAATPLHQAYESVCQAALEQGVRVTGTEIIGLIPQQALMAAGRYYMEQEGEASGKQSETDIMKKAVRAMGLDDLKPFHIEEKVIEYRMKG